jgi:hypothetical protein
MLDLPQYQALWIFEEATDTVFLIEIRQNHGIKWLISQ